MFVPAIGHIFPAITRNGVGPLSTHSSSAGGGVGAHAGHLQPRGATIPGGSSAFQARASGQDQIYTEEDRSQPPVTCHRSCVSGVGTQISRLFGVLKSTCYFLSIEVHKLEKPQLLHEDIEANTI